MSPSEPLVAASLSAVSGCLYYYEVSPSEPLVAASLSAVCGCLYYYEVSPEPEIVSTVLLLLNSHRPTDDRFMCCSLVACSIFTFCAFQQSGTIGAGVSCATNCKN